MSKLFEAVQLSKPKRSKFDLSHEKKLTCNMGELIPIFLQEVIPGDSYKVSTEIFMRLAPMVAPTMHRINVWTHYFFVPNRLTWEEWEDFITGGDLGDLLPIMPTIKIDSQSHASGMWVNATLADYFGIPQSSVSTEGQELISALPFRAYQLIYNEFYRDQNLEPKISVSKTSGIMEFADAQIITTKRVRAWEKDYFTSALPFSQKGGEAAVPIQDFTYKDKTDFVRFDTGAAIADGTTQDTDDGRLRDTVEGIDSRVENIDSFGVTSVNELRKAVKLQEWLEKTARTGSRYIEQILSHFGVKSSDARLQRPEFLGGGKNPVVISEVLNTTGDAEGINFVPVGEMSGHGLAVSGAHGFKRSFEEHGFIIGLMSVLPKTQYQQGINRLWSRQDKFDYYWPEFANLGEQEIKLKELWFSFEDDDDRNNTFGYQQRYAEYKYQPSTVHGDFQDNMNKWHLGRIFENKPELNKEFVISKPDDRIFAVTADRTQHLWIQLYNKVSALRPMPYFSIPSL